LGETLEQHCETQGSPIKKELDKKMEEQEGYGF